MTIVIAAAMITTTIAIIKVAEVVSVKSTIEPAKKAILIRLNTFFNF